MGKKVVFVARDAAPSSVFTQVASSLNERGYSVTLIVGNGKPMTQTDQEIISAVSSADMVVLGISANKADAAPEILAGETAKRLGIPYGFYADGRTHYTLASPGSFFQDLAPDAGFYLGVNQAYADLGRDVFPKARLIGVGSILLEDMAFPRFTREEVRVKLGIEPYEKMVLAPGSKGAVQDILSWGIIMEALAQLTKEGQSFQLILTKHPGDRTQFGIDPTTQRPLGIYDQLIEWSPLPTRMIGRDIMTTSEMVPGADIIIAYGTSVEKEGACQGIPVVSLGFEVLHKVYREITGSHLPETVQDGLSELVVADSTKLAEVVKRLLTPEGFAPLLSRQKEVCVKPAERGQALRQMCDTIERLIAE